MRDWYFLSDVLAVRPGLSGRFGWIAWIPGRVAEEGSEPYPSNASPLVKGIVKGIPSRYQRPFHAVAEDLQIHWMPEFWAKYTPKHYTLKSDGISQ